MAIRALFSVLLLVPLAATATSRAIQTTRAEKGVAKDPKILILGGGVTGIIAARTLYEKGYNNFAIIEARDELGGRLRSHTFGRPGRELTVEVGANWVQGTQDKDGPKNPIFALVEKHHVKTVFSDFTDSMSTYDNTGAVDYLNTFKESVGNHTTMITIAGERVEKSLVDASSRTGYSIAGAKPQTPYEKVSEYYHFDWEYAQTPEQTSWIASSWADNFTFDPSAGGFSRENLFSIDQRGFKTLIVDEGKEFLKENQVLLNHTVRDIDYSTMGVRVTMVDGTELTGDYAICTFSLGVLQNDDVIFNPALPRWKREAIESMVMATYTKIFLQFPEKFWFDTQFALYADSERGRYPVWQGLDLGGFFPGSGVMIVTVTGDYSRRIEALPDAQVKAEVMDVLRSMFPNVTIQEPEDFYFPRWLSDPLYRGSYSNWPPSFYSEHHDNLRATVNQRLWFAGEHTSQKWFGFLHGAYYEGLDVGDAISDCIKLRGCVGLGHVKEVKLGRPYKIRKFLSYKHYITS